MPDLQPLRDETHVFYDHPPEGEAIIKRLMGWTVDTWKLRQFNPLLDFEEARVDWPTKRPEHYGILEISAFRVSAPREGQRRSSTLREPPG